MAIIVPFPAASRPRIPARVRVKVPSIALLGLPASVRAAMARVVATFALEERRHRSIARIAAARRAALEARSYAEAVSASVGAMSLPDIQRIKRMLPI
ncbi:MAG TPA: hypothetical protein VF342_04450 [Alphaproteobacteria bacterium]